MQPLKTFDEVDEIVAKRLGDPKGIRFDAQFRRDAINLGQREYVDRSGVLIARAPIIDKENRSIYEFPEDCVRPLRLENKKGEEILPKDSSYLQRKFGNCFRSRMSSTSSDPKFYYSDLAGDGSFELYPRPSTDFSKDDLEFTEGTFRLIRNLAGEALAMDNIRDDLFVLTTNNLYTFRAFEDGLTLVRNVVHGLGVGYSGNTTGRMRVIKYNFNNNQQINDPNAIGTVYFLNGASIVKVLNDGTVSTFGTASSTIKHMLEFEYLDPFRIYYQLDDFTINRTLSFLNFAQTLVTTETVLIVDSTANFNDNNIYYALGSGGLKKVITASNTIATVSTNNVQGVAALPDSDSTVYFLDETDKLLKKLTPVNDNITATTIATVKPFGAGPILSNHQDRIWFADDDTTTYHTTATYMQEVVNDVKTRSVYNSVNRGSVFTNPSLFSAIGEFVFTHAFFFSISVSSFEHGAIVFIEEEDGGDGNFNQDEGAVLDIEDSEDVVNFNSEQGVIETINIDQEVAYVVYARRPLEDVIEIREYEALVDYAKYLAKQDSTDAKSIRESRIHLSRFNSRADRVGGKAAKGFVPNSNGVQPVNY